ncbi:MAG: Crp/Fnr family transcriptional regulator [Burkholderiaceae bacterium]|jgi:CRP-like cAMP-binding protein|nr:Crp/Fnr family transcriptional regulator [Burkholderiaceae bacterium]
MALHAAGRTIALAPGEIILRRGQPPDPVMHLNSGRVAMGILQHGALVHDLGALQGPFWLNASCAVLQKSPVLDMVAQSAVELLLLPLAAFEAALKNLAEPGPRLLHDMALAHRHQAKLAVSRLVKDAEARCAEWLLRHAEPEPGGQPGALTVFLRERKRLIAAHLGIAPETFSRVLRQLRERSLISGSGRVLRLIDPPALRALAAI